MLRGNLHILVKICWREDAVAATDNTKDVHAAREALEKLKLVDGPITVALKVDVQSLPAYHNCVLAYVVFMVYFEHDGVPMSMLLDLVEVAKSHLGVNLAEAFAKVLEEFGIEDKVN
ncbi:hypothetical protein M413DRAFT_32393 [Hebeloma cylindrosporum]|uniref:Uncharacterized protein n=1 Tax=Hebeloma cylindrosporum TaxID=76867 RepID=A0A0C2Y3K1_HEBCY|nr:hypothetical protein M413DRAFT_32393 [Hebeloma cylindrosporum h7]